MIKIRTASALAVGAVAALALGGTALAAGADDPSVPMLPNGDVVTPPSLFSSPTPSPSVSTPASSPSSSTAISLDAAEAIAVRAAGGGRVTKVEREAEHGRAVWDVDVVLRGVEHDIDVDRATGAVLRHRVKGGSSAVSTTDDRGRGRDSDDRAGDDRGRGRGSDDNGGDDHGRHGGHGSDD
ncbi:PepSY domain-containing protein [Actinoplanes sp. NPDC049316]|uniref:PepSY domain-containing protein n=1 Tax=Actinoplanes sp. NPDC049316 TaxID=3154727 RepID=UPI0034213D4A